MTQTTGTAAVDLYWLPLGAGGQSVRLNGRVFEAVAARLKHRSVRDLRALLNEFHRSGATNITTFAVGDALGGAVVMLVVVPVIALALGSL